MLEKLRNNKTEEQGFTLIELLVVVIIIGILAAIAIPTFLSQRARGWEAELTSAVRNYSLEVEAAATSSGGTAPATNAAPTAPTGILQGGDISLTYEKLTTSPNAFSVCGSSNKLNNRAVSYNNTSGGMGQVADGTCATPNVS